MRSRASDDARGGGAMGCKEWSCGLRGDTARVPAGGWTLAPPAAAYRENTHNPASWSEARKPGLRKLGDKLRAQFIFGSSI